MKEIILEEVVIFFPESLVPVPQDMFADSCFLMTGRASFFHMELDTSEIEKIEYVNNDDILTQIPLESLTKKALIHAYKVFDAAAWKRMENE